ncbi:MAG: GNAT family N-acetyltransferase [Chloroflexota bacterium]|nr:GNAT family N-acetyltransferase [Chloroflexota bacterium]
MPVTATATAVPLTEADIPRLRLPGRRSNEQTRDTLRSHPGRSVWVPGTLEHLLIGSWRNRREISSIEELSAVRHLPALVEQAIVQCHLQGDELLLALELESHRGRSRFERAGLQQLEEVITYEIETLRVPLMQEHHLAVQDACREDNALLLHLLALDNVAFPWLWRNSLEEFWEYLDSPGVHVLAVSDRDEIVAYIGITEFEGWGHIDRVAVQPERQGKGYGQAAVMLGLDALRRGGARRVGLSTQRSNVRSQRLYERLGFQRTPELDYHLYGALTGASSITAR